MPFLTACSQILVYFEDTFHGLMDYFSVAGCKSLTLWALQELYNYGADLIIKLKVLEGDLSRS